MDGWTEAFTISPFLKKYGDNYVDTPSYLGLC